VYIPLSVGGTETEHLHVSIKVKALKEAGIVIFTLRLTKVLGNIFHVLLDF